MKAKEDWKEFSIVGNTSLGDKQIQINLLGKQKKEYTVSIGNAFLQILNLVFHKL